MNFVLYKHRILKKLEQYILEKRVSWHIKSNPLSKRYTRKYNLDSQIIRVEFYLMDAFEIYHYLPIYNALLKEKNFSPVFICEPCKNNVHGDWFNYIEAKKILESLNLTYNESVNVDAEIAISTQHIRTLDKYKKVKINLQYGTGFNKTNFCNTLHSVIGYDYRFNYSNYTNKNLSKYMNKNRMFNIGLPKHDILFNKKMQKKIFNTNKQILIYYPTWDEDSTVNLFYDELKKLKTNYFIITKAHHCTFRLDSKKEELKKIYEISDIVLEGNSDFAESAHLADIAIIDAKSGASTEVPYLNPDIKILYLSPRKNLKKYFYKDVFKYGYITNEPKFLGDFVRKIDYNDKFISFRKKITDYYMGSFDGNASKRAIDAIKSIAEYEYKIKFD